MSIKNVDATTKSSSKKDGSNKTGTTTAAAASNAAPASVVVEGKDKFHYEFGGPIGCFLTMLFLPLVVMLLLYWTDIGYVTFDGILEMTSNANNNSSNGSSSSIDIVTSILHSSVLCPSCCSSTAANNRDDEDDGVGKHTLVLIYCMLGLIGWFVFQVLLERCLPYDLVEGNYVQNNVKNGKLSYRINGHLAFWFTLIVVQIGYPTWYNISNNSTNTNGNGNDNEEWILQFTHFPLHEILYKNYPELAFSSIVLCTILSFYLYISSFFPINTTSNNKIKKKQKILAVGGNSGNHIYDFWIGRELNPRIHNIGFLQNFDWKVFCELRPGLIFWLLLNLSCLYEQHRKLGYVTGSMILINIFQGIYIWDALYYEKSILTTMDITTDGFGFMLIFGDLCWVPFTYSIQAKYLVNHDPHLSTIQLTCIVILYCFGLFLFRNANTQKDIFRKDPTSPKVQHLKYMQTKRGTKLLISGYWGLARKINYTGDYIMGVTWCLLCGFNSIVPYYYAIYFAILLIHRSIRDDNMCYEKYGNDWLLYKQLVPYRFIPGIV